MNPKKAIEGTVSMATDEEVVRFKKYSCLSKRKELIEQWIAEKKQGKNYYIIISPQIN